MRVILERATLHQSRFRTPGLSADARGVALGKQALLLFPSLDRAVAFFRGYAEDASLTEIASSTSIVRATTALRTEETLVILASESSHRLDRIAALTKLAAGLVFTGTGRHFVRYRDADSPLGYDAVALVTDPADAIVYDHTFTQAYTFKGTLTLLDLVGRVALDRSTKRPFRGRALVSVPVGLGRVLVGYFHRWAIDARVAMLELPAESAFDEGTRRYLFDLVEIDGRLLALLSSLPGTQLYQFRGTSIAVEYGFSHPIAPDGADGVVPADALWLFSAEEATIRLSPVPTFAPVRTLVRGRSEALARHESIEGRSTSLTSNEPFALQIRVVADPAQSTRPRAAVVPRTDAAALALTLYVMPKDVLARLRIAIAPEAFFLLDREGLEGVAVGTLYREVADHVFVPIGSALAPHVAPSIVRELFVRTPNAEVFIGADGRPLTIEESHFGAVTRGILEAASGIWPTAGPLPANDSPQRELQYRQGALFPLWGAVGLEDENDAHEERND